MPAFLRPLVPIEDELWQRCCSEHDEDYRKGGTETDRFIADVRFLLRMLVAGVDPTWAERYYLAVRMHGRSSFGSGQPIEWPQAFHNEAP